MPETLGNAGVYFDAENPASISAALLRLHGDPKLASDLAARARARSEAYDWKRTASETFSFLFDVARASCKG
jgi:glycosyltransferase involved in cell wall biosynthesis